MLHELGWKQLPVRLSMVLFEVPSVGTARAVAAIVARTRKKVVLVEVVEVGEVEVWRAFDPES